MSIIDDLKNVIDELEQSDAENSRALAAEYKNAVAILTDDKKITSCNLKHVIFDLAETSVFDNSKTEEYERAIEKLQNASI